MIIGDTGEQDASQYVVCPSLSAAVRAHEPGFVMIASDVIYPAGDVDDYRDGVYRPYRSPDPHFSVAAPLLGLPGNHDWYDGLSGFMYHFANQDLLPAEAYTPPRITPRSVLGRLFRILWRRARPPRSETELLHAVGQTGWENPLTRTLAQPGPYYAVQTKHLLLVAIDTGIDGHLDREQWDWLTEVSRRPGPKVLVTGKPLLVNAKLQPCWVGPKPKDGVGDSVWKLVNRPEYEYLATVGGDVHNFQKYVPEASPARSCIWSLGVAGRSCTRPTRTRMPTSTPGPATTPPAASTRCPRSPSPPVTSRSGTSPGCWCPGWSG